METLILIGSLVIFLGMLYLYFLPTILGINKKNHTALLVLNTLIGWTLIGWLICLIWGLTKD